ncbi:DUF742 domain-containing protein [Streptomyces sp. NPDC050428]|uniref:DUF742 domain-containing protein n=1 Tax=Streptomyces sp. NPDC050428 TaxID=3155757 RepID=UPI0034394EF0
MDAAIRLDTTVAATGAPGHPPPGTVHARALHLCRDGIPVTEIAALLGIPVAVAGAIVYDLRASGWVETRETEDLEGSGVASIDTLRRVKKGLENWRQAAR